MNSLKPIKVRLPHNLDLNRLLEAEKPSFSYEPDYFRYLVNLVIERPAFDKTLMEQKDGRPFVPLYSQILKSVVGHYEHYLDYLLRHNILEGNGKYTLGGDHGKGCSKGYRLTAQYSTLTVSDKISKPKVIRKINKSNEAIRKKGETGQIGRTDEYNYLTRWLGSLEIDAERAHRYLDTVLESNLSIMKEEEALAKDTAYRIMVDQIEDNPFRCSIDNTGYRLHTVLTNCKKELRAFLTYKGRRLVTIDLSCSQPFLSLLLFNVAFYRRRLSQIENPLMHISELEPSTIRKINPFIDEIRYILSTSRYFEYNILINDNINVSNIKLYNINYTQAYTTTSTQTKTYPMCAKPLQQTDNQGWCFSSDNDLITFHESVKSGKFYQYLQNSCLSPADGQSVTLEEAKEVAMKILFAYDKIPWHQFASYRQQFKTLFPSVYEVYSLIKSEWHANLAHLLQNIESTLFLKRISQRISREYPKVPIYTIHDSIVTTVGYEHQIKKIMIEEITKAIGVKPNLKTELWNIDGGNGLPIRFIKP